MAKKKTYTFSENRQAKSGITSMVLGVTALLILLVMGWIVWKEKGQAGMYVGAFGFTSAVMSLAGMIVGLLSFREKHVHHTSSKAGSILNAVVLVIWIFIFLLGVS
ncbi:MAG: DUF6142 family protein [Eubacteriales bacterium]|nr:DUF6142 family protein [Eubacteriales bacterium]